MRVVNTRHRDPIVNAVAGAIAPVDLVDADHRNVAVVLGPPGFGKSSVLNAAAALSARRLGARVVWVSGAVVAGEAHLARLLFSGGGPDPVQDNGERTDDSGEGYATTSLDAAFTALEKSTEPVVVAIDDLDALVFKREGLAEQLARLALSGAVHLMASCKPAGGRRLMAQQHPFAAAVVAHGGRIASASLAALNDEAAHALIRRRAPRLTEAAIQVIIDAAGGHPAALVFLSRLTELRGRDLSPRSPIPNAPRLPELFARAAEFAGAVYAEAWAALGPQQRAVIWQLSTSTGPTTAAEIAQFIALSPSHVSAQLTRLVGDGLVSRTAIRGQFMIAPLLAEWIVRRAARAGMVPESATARVARARGTDRSRSIATRQTHVSGPVLSRLPQEEDD